MFGQIVGGLFMLGFVAFAGYAIYTKQTPLDAMKTLYGKVRGK
jgi:hypothetical protein